MSKTSVFGIVKTHSQAEQIVESLQSAGFAASEISVLLPDNQGKHDIGHVKATKAPEGATAGAATGGVTGGVLGLLAGIGALWLELRSRRLRESEKPRSTRFSFHNLSAIGWPVLLTWLVLA